MNSLFILIGAILLFIGGFFFSRKTNQTDAKIIDLTSKIQENQNKAAMAKEDADAKTKAYIDELNSYDPNFHSDDDSDGTPHA